MIFFCKIIIESISSSKLSLIIKLFNLKKKLYKLINLFEDDYLKIKIINKLKKKLYY